MTKSEHINELAEALNKAQIEMPVALKTSDNPYFKSKYADLAQIIELSTPILTKHGLSISQFPISSEDRAGVRTFLMHKNGQYIEDMFIFSPKDKTPQGFASCVTYARRYAWQSVIGMAADTDDDGNKASGFDKKKDDDFIPITKEQDKKAACLKIRDWLKIKKIPESFITKDYECEKLEDLKLEDLDFINGEKYKKRLEERYSQL